MIFTGPIIIRDLTETLEQRHSGCTGPYCWVPQDRTEQRVGGQRGHPRRGFYMGKNDAMDRQGSTFRLRLAVYDSEGFSGNEGLTEWVAVIARLPRGRGFLAGATMGEGMGSFVDGHIWDDEDDAARAARDEAIAAAERDAEDPDLEEEEDQ